MSHLRQVPQSLPDHNNIQLTRVGLTQALDYLSLLLEGCFPSKVRLVVHGGALMVLHQELTDRYSTRDVDYIGHFLDSEWATVGVFEARNRLTTCIRATAQAFGLDEDWMNAAPDSSLANFKLPIAGEPAHACASYCPWMNAARAKYAITQTWEPPHKFTLLVEPIYHDALYTTVKQNIIFDSPGLMLIGVSWAWAIALKLIRFVKDDPRDIASILRLGTVQRQVEWTVPLLYPWLSGMCPAMGFANYSPDGKADLERKMQEAIDIAYPPQPQRPDYQSRRQRAVHPSQSHHNTSSQPPHGTYAPPPQRVVYPPQHQDGVFLSQPPPAVYPPQPQQAINPPQSQHSMVLPQSPPPGYSSYPPNAIYAPQPQRFIYASRPQHDVDKR